ncbi:xanthine dehydrogenase family protein molybdopterin-binding subunit [Scopulibacillus cellulosilyticus]|uniref:Xanthine dehydrogenase family protein molybdopterin-binding subunit n=1 Tax=Scopulibacillus cellulosilyticus TaxID=2665665 RepID=A0ABW2PUI3_9BACL
MTIGIGVKRVEDPNLITGNGKYVGDINLADQCEAVVVRSTRAHANIISINKEAAEKSPGVLKILTSADLPDDLPPIPMRLSPEKSLNYALQYPLAKERVRYVGEPIALVVATSRYAAEDAADLINIQYSPLPPVIDVYQSIKLDAPLLHPDIGSNDLFVIHSKKGNFENQLKACPFVLEKELTIQRHSGVPLETRGLVAAPEPDHHLTVYGAAKVVHFNHQVLAKLLKKDMADIRLVETDVGGGFGVRGEFYPEDYLIPYAAMQIGRPVRWIEDRLEHMKTTNHSREQKHRVTAGFNEKGRILAFRDEIFVDTGAYIRTHGVTVPELTQGMLPGPYDIHALEIVTHVIATNKTPVGTYRGPGRFEGTFVRERIIDMIAQELKIDPTVIRERNVIRKDQMPYTNGIYALGQEIKFDSGDYQSILNKARLAVQWENFEERRKLAEADGRLLGLGFAMFVEKSGLGPWEFCEVEISKDGHAFCKTGLADVGQGMKTMLSQICSQQLGIPYDKIKVIHGDTDKVEKGNGSFATRGTVVGGSAAWYASQSLKNKLLDTASKLLSISSDQLNLSDESVMHTENKLKLIPIEELISECYKKGIQLKEKYTFSTDHMTYPYGVHAAEVEIDLETGKIKINKYQIAYDVGRSINPSLVGGQLIGGMAQGLGGTLYEELKYDETGQLLSGTFMDYLIPTAKEVPEVNINIYENELSPLNPLGVKGAGEGGTVGVAPAIANAVMNALREYSIEIISLPIRPDMVREVIRNGKKSKVPPEARS